MASIDESLDSNKIAHIQALMLQSPNNISGNAIQLSHSPEALRKPLSAPSQPDGHGKSRSLPNTKASRRPIGSMPDMTAMVAETPSQKQPNYSRAVSFPGLPMNLDGDTQVMPSQVYRDYEKSMYNPTSDGNGKANNTLQEGDAGHINIASMWNGESQIFSPLNQEDRGEVQSVDGSEAGSQRNETQDLLSSMRKESQFKTPATIGQKRNRQGEPLSPSTVSKTPGSGLANFFGGNDARPMMTNTQLFNATQAESSPLVDMPRSDPIESRPSPNFGHVNDTSPAPHTESSPTKSTMPLPNGPTDPKDVYTSMVESQKRRRQMQQAALAPRPSSKVLFDEDSLDEDAFRQGRVDHHKQYRQGQVGATWSVPKAITKSSFENKLPTTTMENVKSPYLTPGIAASRIKHVVEISDDVSDDEGSVDMYDEYAQEVVPSQRQVSEEPRDESPLLEDHEHIDDTVDERQGSDTDDEENEDQPHIPMSPQVFETKSVPKGRESAPPPGTSSAFLAVADSQPDKTSSQPPLRGVEPSSIASFVPGSQIAPLSSQTRAQLEAKVDLDKSSSLPQPPGASIGYPQPPSSPPIPESSHKVSEEDRIQIVSQSAEDDSGNGHNVIQAQIGAVNQEIAQAAGISTDSVKDQYGDLALVGSSESRGQATEAPQTVMAAPSMFETARTHLSASQASRRSTRQVSESPRKAAGIRLPGDIAHDPTPDSSREAEINIPMDFMTEEDNEYLSMMNSPAKNKRAVTYGRRAKPAKSAPQQSAPIPIQHNASIIQPPSGTAQSEPASSPVRPQQKRRKIRGSRAVVFDDEEERENSVSAGTSAAEAPPATCELVQDQVGLGRTRSEVVVPSERVHRSDAHGMATPEQAADGVQDTDKVISAEAMDIDILNATPPSLQANSSTPQSVRKREQAGMQAAAQARDAIFAAKGLKRGREEPKKGRKKLKSVKRRSVVQDSTEAGTRPTPSAKAMDSDREVIGETTAVPEPVADEMDVDVAAVQQQDTTVTSSNLVNPACENRVLAFFKGSPTGYYPATCVGTQGSVDTPKYNIRFDDGSTTLLESHQICAFDLREGDVVKVDDTRQKSKLFIVDGFGSDLDLNHKENFPTSDIHGHLTVRMYQRSRDSLPTPPGTKPTTIEVPIGTVYVVQSAWSSMKGRTFVYNPKVQPQRYGTPSTDTSGPVTPKSRNRRQSSLLGFQHAQALPPMKPLPATGVFTNMAFALSYGSKEADRERIIKQITQNGGRMLEGFHDLFQPTDTNPSLILRPWAQDLGFVALIADTHSRREKYFQALSLSLPVLHGRWIADSLTHNAPRDWQPYLLPAGESVFLSRAVRSRTLAPYPAHTATLATIVEKRTRLLGGGGVLLIAGMKAKEQEKRRIYAFLSLALGAAEVKMVTSAPEAKDLVASEKGKWGWVHCDDKSLASVREVFNAKRGKKDTEEGEFGLSVRVNDLRIVGDEFVVQSLILGALVE